MGSRVKVHLYDRRLNIYLGGIKTVELERVFAVKGARGPSVNYQHVIGALVQKPRAFRHSQWRVELLPTGDYHRIWRYVDDKLTPDKACIYIVRILHLAHKINREETLGRFVLEGIAQGRYRVCLTVKIVLCRHPPPVPSVTVQQHALSQYQSPLQGGCHD